MRHRTHRQRAERKMIKAGQVTAAKAGQMHVNYHTRAGYHEITTSVKSKSEYTVLRNAHPGRGIEKLVLFPKLFWHGSRGTYRRSMAV